MKKILMLTLALLTCSAVTRAQVDPDKRDNRIAVFRAEVYSRVLRFTPEEAQGFWPVYNEYLDKRDQLQQDLKPAKQEDQMSDSEVEAQIQQYFERKQREFDLEKDLYQKLRKVLPIRKIAKIQMAEREFREALIKKLQDNRQKRLQQGLPVRPGLRGNR